MTAPTDRRAYALPSLIAGGVAVGVAPILVRLSEVGPLSTAFWRLWLAIPLLLALTAATRGPDQGDVRRTPRTFADLALVSAPGVFLGAELCVWHVSLHMTSVANATLLVNMTPVFAALFGWAAFGRPVSRTFAAGLLLAVGGVAALTSGGRGGAGSLAGDAVALFAAMIYAGYFLLLGRARRDFSAAAVMLASTVSAALATLPLALAESAFAPATLAGWAALVALAWIVQAGGQGLVTFAIAWLPATVSSLAMLIQPVVAAGLAWTLFDERLSALQIAGGAVVLLGILIARRG
ncbi:MAG: EamA family transporter [Ancylobacter novellus]|uniref:EamA family transporter n=1 Tax=Ancylobacter novellus TaxID=921 RepID=A0A2W5KBL7_ANCNO|nr:MAG: EamA family transporter [Ancylobacter novellus]